MAASTSEFTGLLGARTRPGPTALTTSSNSARSPRTPLLGRSISSQFGSPGSFRVEQEDILVYELSARHFAAGYAGESKPRCILPFSPEGACTVGDYRQHDAEYVRNTRQNRLKRPWSEGYELFSSDLHDRDLGLVEDKLDRVLRTVHTDFLQLDQKPRKAALVVPSSFPTPLLEIALSVLFGHHALPPSIAVLTPPVMCCVSAGLRNALVVDIGWEETTVTAVGEYKEVYQRWSIKAGKLFTQEIGYQITDELQKKGLGDAEQAKLTFAEAEDLAQRIAWCQPLGKARKEIRESSMGTMQDEGQDPSAVSIPVPGTEPQAHFSMPFAKVAEPADRVFFATSSSANEHDDHDLPIHMLAYRVLLALPLDLRAVCLGRVVVSGMASNVPGLKRRLLQELNQSIKLRGWDPVANYGSAAKKRQQTLESKSTNLAVHPRPPLDGIAFSSAKMRLQESIPHVDRVHDDVKDPITLKAERGNSKAEIFGGEVRGVETLGPWVGASLMASMRVKGVHEIERDDFLKNGLRSFDALYQ